MYPAKLKSIRTVGALAALVPAILASSLTSSVSSDKSLSEKDQYLPIPQWLYVCSPYKSFDGMRALDFSRKDHSVRMTEEVSGESRTAAAHSKGTWEADEKAKRVNIDLGSERIRYGYTAVMTSSLDQCILAAGDITSADLRNSWFGGPISTRPLP
jgi:hypothetical protein